MSMDPFANGRYDIWKTSPPEYAWRPLVCSHCHERIDDTENHDEGEGHCPDEDDGSVYYGRLEWDWSYDWRDDDPRIP